MTASEIPSRGEPQLSSDFAARVIRRADRVVARQRQARHAIAATAVVVIAIAATYSGLHVSPAPKVPPPAAATDSFADADAGWLSASGQTEDADALDYLFPDAAPMASFADQYAAASYDDGTDSDSQDAESDSGT
jgi:hypothetical protein